MAQVARERLTAEERRRAVLAAARHVFAQRGFDGAGVAEIAARCGCTEPLLYRHFPSKQALFAAVLTDVSERLAERVEQLAGESEEPLEALLAIVKGLADDELMLEAIRVRLLAVSLVDDAAIRDALERSVTAMHERVTGLLARAKRRGSLRSDIDPSEAAWLWFGFVLARGYRAALFEGALADSVTTATTLIRLLESPETSSAKEAR